MVKPRLHTTGRGIAISKADFEAVGGYDEGMGPQDPQDSETMYTERSKQREDLDFGRRVEAMFGTGAVHLDRGAIVGEAKRRPVKPSLDVWTERGWRRGTAIQRIRRIRA